MHASGKVNVVAVFGPEHGFRGTGQAGDGEGDHIDPRTGIKVYDAYGANAAKFAELYAKSGVETVVFDIQDVGARFYTYIWTMFEAMLAAVQPSRSSSCWTARTRSAARPAGRCSRPGSTPASASRRSSSSTA